MIAKYTRLGIIIFFVLCYGLLSCATPTKNRSVTIEEGFDNSLVREVYMKNSNEMCILISQKELWEPGDTAHTLANRIQTTSEIKIDGKQIRKLVFSSDGIVNSIIHNREIIGTYGSELKVCFSLEHEVGPHSASFILERSDGKKATYGWNFEIKDSN